MRRVLLPCRWACCSWRSRCCTGSLAWKRTVRSWLRSSSRSEPLYQCTVHAPAGAFYLCVPSVRPLCDPKTATWLIESASVSAAGHAAVGEHARREHLGNPGPWCLRWTGTGPIARPRDGTKGVEPHRAHLWSGVHRRADQSLLLSHGVLAAFRHEGAVRRRHEILPPISGRYLYFWIYCSLVVVTTTLNRKRVDAVWLALGGVFLVVTWTANRGIPHFVFASALLLAGNLGALAQRGYDRSDSMRSLGKAHHGCSWVRWRRSWRLL